MENKEIKIICYADDADAILTPQDEDDSPRLVHEFNTKPKEFNMTISAQKTKAIVINKEPTKCKIEIESVSLEHVMKTKYLGITLSSHGDVEEAVRD